MSTATTQADVGSLVPPPMFPTGWTLADLQDHLGGVPVERSYPLPGTASEADALNLDEHSDSICELVDGVLVEKVISSFESLLAMTLGHILNTFLERKNLGIVLGEAGQLWILPKRMRVPDLAFIRWDRFPGGKLPQDRVYRVAPDLVVEILSQGNTPGEMQKKLGEYFESGVRLVWYIDPRTRSAAIPTALDQCQNIDGAGTLDGRDVLPGFQLRLGELFERANRGR